MVSFVVPGTMLHPSCITTTAVTIAPKLYDTVSKPGSKLSFKNELMITYNTMWITTEMKSKVLPSVQNVSWRFSGLFKGNHIRPNMGCCYSNKTNHPLCQCSLLCGAKYSAYPQWRILAEMKMRLRKMRKLMKYLKYL